MKIGDKVRVIGTPENLPDNDIAAKQIFELCVGRIFPIEDVRRVEGLGQDVIELLVGEVVGEPDYMHSIYIEPKFLELVRDED